MDPLVAGNVIQVTFVLGLMVQLLACASPVASALCSLVCVSHLLTFFNVFCKSQVAYTGTYVFRVMNKQMTYAKQLDDYEEAVMLKRCAAGSAGNSHIAMDAVGTGN